MHKFAKNCLNVKLKLLIRNLCGMWKSLKLNFSEYKIVFMKFWAARLIWKAKNFYESFSHNYGNYWVLLFKESLESSTASVFDLKKGVCFFSNKQIDHRVVSSSQTNPLSILISLSIVLIFVSTRAIPRVKKDIKSLHFRETNESYPQFCSRSVYWKD